MSKDILVVPGLVEANEAVMARAIEALERDGAVHRLDDAAYLGPMPAEPGYPGTEVAEEAAAEATQAYLEPATELLGRADRVVVVNPDGLSFWRATISHGISRSSFAVMRKTALHLPPGQLQVSHALPATSGFDFSGQYKFRALSVAVNQYLTRVNSLRPRPLYGEINGVKLNDNGKRPV